MTGIGDIPFPSETFGFKPRMAGRDSGLCTYSNTGLQVQQHYLFWVDSVRCSDQVSSIKEHGEGIYVVMLVNQLTLVLQYLIIWPHVNYFAR